MNLVTRFELAAKSKNELRGLLREAFKELAGSEFGSHERRNALASIENIQRQYQKTFHTTIRLERIAHFFFLSFLGFSIGVKDFFKYSLNHCRRSILRKPFKIKR